MRNRSIRAFSFGLVTGAVITAGITVLAAPANAEPTSEVLEYAIRAEGAVCRSLSKYPTVYGVRGILEAVAAQGFTPYEAGEIVAVAVLGACPEFLPVLERFVAIYSPGDLGATV